MNNKTKQINPRKLYWIAFAIYAVAAVIFALIDGSGDFSGHMHTLITYFIAFTVHDIRCDVEEIKRRLEYGTVKIIPEAIDANYNPVE